MELKELPPPPKSSRSKYMYMTEFLEDKLEALAADPNMSVSEDIPDGRSPSEMRNTMMVHLKRSLTLPPGYALRSRIVDQTLYIYLEGVPCD